MEICFLPLKLTEIVNRATSSNGTGSDTVIKLQEMPLTGCSMPQHDYLASWCVICAKDHSITDDDSVGIHIVTDVIKAEHEQLSGVSRNNAVKVSHVAKQTLFKTKTRSVVLFG